jgi:hypothetical protein
MDGTLERLLYRAPKVKHSNYIADKSLRQKDRDKFVIYRDDLDLFIL